MRHVADGDLHAYLDGGLDHHPPDEAGRIREHLDACASCRDRLEDERRARGRAAAVLACADPGAVDAPPFEELRRRALAGDGDARPGRASGLGRAGWLRIAATAVVALGVGWMGGRMSPYGSPSPASPVFEADSAPEEGADPERPGRGARSEVVTGSREEAASPAGRVEEETGFPSQGEAARAPQDRAARQASEPLPAADPEERLLRARVAVPPAQAEMADVPGSSVDSIAEAGERGEGAGPRADSITASAGLERRARPSQLLAVAPGVEAERVRVEAAPTGGADPLAVSGDVAGARSLLPGGPDFPVGVDRSMAIPGLTVVTVQWTEVAPGVEGFRVVQRLVTGDSIELRFGGLDSNADEPDSLLGEALPHGIQQVVAPFGDGWVVARARLTSEEIRALIGLLR